MTGGQKERPEDHVVPGEQIKDPFVLEFLDLKDEYSESDLEETLIRHLESFLLAGISHIGSLQAQRAAQTR